MKKVFIFTLLVFVCGCSLSVTPYAMESGCTLENSNDTNTGNKDTNTSSNLNNNIPEQEEVNATVIPEQPFEVWFNQLPNLYSMIEEKIKNHLNSSKEENIKNHS